MKTHDQVIARSPFKGESLKIEDLNKTKHDDQQYTGRWQLKVTDERANILYNNEFVDRNRATPPDK